MNIATLLIGPETTQLLANAEASPPIAVVLQVGDQRLVREQFAGAFPRAAQLESAIAVVEDALMASTPRAERLEGLVVRDATLHGVALASGFADGARIRLDLADVERLFGRLSAVSQSSPASHQGLPHDAPFAARLLILRELMHHWHVASVDVANDAT